MNALSNNVITADRKKLKSANGMYLGSTGSGKSFAAKRELINVFLATNDRIIVVDPMGEYAPLVRRLGGQVIEIAPDSPHHISPIIANSAPPICNEVTLVKKIRCFFQHRILRG